MRTLTEIRIYPVKSLGGISLQEARVEARGLQHDRRWMLVDGNGRFLSQREMPELALLQPAIVDNSLIISHKSKKNLSCQLPLQVETSGLSSLQVQIWDDVCPGLLMPAATHEWFSEALGRPVRLVYMPDSTQRQVDMRYAPPGQYVRFADGFPFLLIGQASLDDLNTRLSAPVPMNRFRPNFVVSGSQAFEEDSWKDFRIGGVSFRVVKPCGRCIIITTDQDSGLRAAEPLKTLSKYRNVNNKVLFGQNVIRTEPADALVRIGDPVTV